MKFSIVFNSRGRSAMLHECLTRLLETSSGKNSLEIIVNIDDDDQETLQHKSYLEREFKELKILVSERFVNCHTKINELAFLAKGDIILPWGDDCMMLTDGWDEAAKWHFMSKSFGASDNIWMGGIDSTSVDKVLHTHVGWYPDIFFITKEGRDANGWLVHPHFISLGADVATYCVYKGADRYIDLRMIKMDHVTHNTIEKVINPDNTAAEYRARQYQRQSVDPFNYNYSDDIAKLKNRTKS